MTAAESDGQQVSFELRTTTGRDVTRTETTSDKYKTTARTRRIIKERPETKMLIRNRLIPTE